MMEKKYPAKAHEFVEALRKQKIHKHAETLGPRRSYVFYFLTLAQLYFQICQETKLDVLEHGIETAGDHDENQ